MASIAQIDESRSTTSASPDDHVFATDHLVTNIKERSLRGGTITLGAQAGKFALQLGSTAALARLLIPADFGLVAMAAVFTGFAQLFTHAGLSMATVQRAVITQGQLNALFWLNFAIAAAIAGLLALLSPVFAAVYSEPRLVGITLLLASGVLCTGTAVQHHAILVRQMRYGQVAAIELLTLLLGLSTAVAMAAAGCGYWSLVGGNLTGTICSAAMLWLSSGWRPGRPASAEGVRSMVRFGGGLTAFNVLEHTIRNADNLIIGATLGSGPLGIYSKAYGLLMLPVSQLSRPLGAVLIPALSRLQLDEVRYRRAFLRAAAVLAFVGVPLIAYLALVADVVVHYLLGPGWEDAVAVFRYLAPAAAVSTVHAVPMWLCMSLGRSRPQLRWALIAAPVLTLAFLVGSHWGILGVAASFTIAWLPLFVLLLLLAVRDSPVSFRSLAWTLGCPHIAAAAAVGISEAVVPQVPGLSSLPLLRAAIHFTVFGVSYACLSLCLPPCRSSMRYLLSDGLRALIPARPGATGPAQDDGP